MRFVFSLYEQLFLVGLSMVLLFFTRVFLISYVNFIPKYSTQAKIIKFLWWMFHLIQWGFYWTFFTCIFYQGNHITPVLVLALVIIFGIPSDIRLQVMFESIIVNNIRKYIKINHTRV